MPRRRRLTIAQRWQIIGRLTGGATQVEVAHQYHVSTSVVGRLFQRYHETNDVKERGGRGARRKTTPVDDRFIVNHALRSRKKTSVQLRNELRTVRGVNVSTQTIRNRLHERNLRARRPVVKVPLTQRHRLARLAWSRAHQRWTRAQWSHVHFSDESSFKLSHRDGRIRVWRRPHERFADTNVVEVDRYGGGAVMVWAYISADSKSELHIVDGTLNARRYLDQIINPIVIPEAQRYGQNFTFMQDNAPAHRARLTQGALTAANVTTIDWPARSPDCNPIEHAWAELGRRVRSRDPPPGTLAEMRRALVEEWRAIPQVTIRGLVQSMRRRIASVIGARGGHTRY